MGKKPTAERSPPRHKEKNHRNKRREASLSSSDELDYFDQHEDQIDRIEQGSSHSSDAKDLVDPLPANSKSSISQFSFGLKKQIKTPSFILEQKNQSFLEEQLNNMMLN